MWTSALISAGKITPTVHYVTNPTNIGQLTWSKRAIRLLNNINSERLQTTVDVQQPAPLTVRVDFAPFDPSDNSGSFM